MLRLVSFGLLGLLVSTASQANCVFRNGFESNDSDCLADLVLPPGTSWQWQLSGTLDTGFDVDMYDVDLVETSQASINQLKAAGRKVICYFSAGSWESYRPDADAFPAGVKGSQLDPPFSDELWLDIRQLDVLGPIMGARLDLAVSKGCFGVEPDNVDGYSNSSGFPLSAADQLAYNRWLAQQAHARGLSVGLKNDLDQVEALVNDFDWALNEQCFEYDECELLTPFIDAGKAVFGVEYHLPSSSFCPQANAMNFDWLKKNIELDAFRESCR
ncbi:endo alpha-1,4 polygalactosaminidase [Pseudomarimonas arenosa]|uniref:Endo alpha-1,4 polygalactosaminidase n=1 Tax=Pseudomarimonas arenosa TaxID=2774145 RepID=A0AAW3ZTF6_9GAMM|nr:endo alpha-1,4 polygalactosaminidase [Pseudomarimonas arenosa]MBD8528100.1 endo alpha-1,4 polygalactosaminidase [Pseudomarimonas arenosa]